jgi:WD40 repeat protein
MKVLGELPRSPLLRDRISIGIVAWDESEAPAPVEAGQTPQLSVNQYTGRPGECDLTIVILWGRLGTPLPESIHKADGSRYESGTVWEYEDALAAGRPIFIYRRAVKPRVDVDDPQWERKRADFQVVERFFDQFRGTDGSLKGGVNRYASADVFGDLFRKHMEAFLNERIHAGAPAASAPGSEAQSNEKYRWRPAWDFGPFLQSKRDKFFGREWLFREVVSWLESSTDPAMLIQAEYGVGKSAFAAKLVEQNPGQVIVAHHCCQHDTNETLSPAEFVWSIAAQLAVVFPAYARQVESEPTLQEALNKAEEDAASAFERAVIAPLDNIDPPAGGNKCIVIDALDESLEFDDTQGSQKTPHIVALLVARTKRLPKWLRIVATTRNLAEVTVAMRGAFESRIINAEDENNIGDLRAYALARCADGVLAEKIAAANVSAETLAEALAVKSGGKFLYAALTLDDMCRGRRDVGDLARLPLGMDGFYLDAFERRFGRVKRDYSLTAALLGFVAAAHEPLSRSDLASMLGRSKDEVQKVIGTISDFLGCRNKCYTFNHLSLVDWLTNEDVYGEPRAANYHISLSAAQELLAAWAKRQVETDVAQDRDYLVRHLAAHLTDAERASVYARLLIDPRWLSRKLALTGVNSLLNEFAYAPREPLFAALESALRQSAYILMRRDSLVDGPSQLPAQLLARTMPLNDASIQRFCADVAGFARTFSKPWLHPLTASLGAQEALLGTINISASVASLAPLPNSRLASGSHDNSIVVWNLATGEAEAKLEGHTNSVSALAVLEDGTLVSGSRDTTIKLWNPATWDAGHTLEGHTNCVATLAALPGGQLASGSYDGTIRVWDTASGQSEVILGDHCGHWVCALALLKDGRLASGSSDGIVRVWNLANRKVEATLGCHTAGINALAVVADGRLASGSSDGTIELWNASNKQLYATLAGDVGGINALAVLRDGRLASGSTSGIVTLWNTNSTPAEATLKGHTTSISALAVLPDGKLASGSMDTTVKLWDPCKGQHEATLRASTRSWVSAMATLSDGRMVSGLSDGSIKLSYPLDDQVGEILKGHSHWVTELAVLPNGRLASSSRDETIKIWDLDSAQVEATLEEHINYVTTLALLPDGKLVSGSRDTTIKIWNLPSRQSERTLRGMVGWISAFAVLSDGRLASASASGVIQLWDTHNGQLQATWEGHTGPVNALVVLSDGRLVSGSADYTIKIWDPACKPEWQILRGHIASVNVLAALPESRFVSGAADGTIVLWAASSRGIFECVASLVVDAPIRSMVALSGRTLAAGDLSGRTHVLEIDD